ncbi:NERD domain-containing protein [Jeotgalibacillus alimentarius]|nr:NERD domain-containing protein [Jeotgalibacillus alimentarius]
MMAQLIKLQDYVSRYEKDMIRYPSQYVRLKKQQWTKIKQQWEDGGVYLNEEEIQRFKEEVEGKEGILKRFKKILVRHEEEPEVEEEPDESDDLSFEPSVYYKPETLDDLKHLYLDQLLHFQLKWASSTLTEKSYVDSKYHRDDHLKFFLQRFPDTFLLMYEPILLLKKAPVELEVLLFTPTALWCISLLDQGEDTVFVGSTERFWKVKKGESEHTQLNPLISLDRTASILQQIFDKNDVDFTIHKAVLSRTGYVDFPDIPYGYKVIDKRSIQKWHDHQRTMSSPFKHMQMKAARAVIEYAQTTSVKRMQWSEADEDLLGDTEE